MKVIAKFITKMSIWAYVISVLVDFVKGFVGSDEETTSPEESDVA